MNRPSPTAALLLASLALLPACSKPAAPDATVPVSARTFRMADGPELSWVRNLPEVHPDFELTPDTVPVPIVFATVRSPAKQTTDPVILRKEGAVWRIQQLPDLHQQEWVYAGCADERHELWAATDAPATPPNPAAPNSAGPRGTQITLLRSTDDGETWTTFSALRKPAPAAEFDSFHLAPKGQGRLTLRLDNDAPNGIRAGLYLYHTPDAGKTWSGPAFEPDDLDDATHSTGTIPDTLRRIESPG